MARMYYEDAYGLGLLYAYKYGKKKMTLKDDLERFHETIEKNLSEMNSDVHDIYATLRYTDETSIYFLSEGKNGEMYLVLYPDFNYEKAKSLYIGCLSTDILVASQMDNALNCLDLKKEDGKIVRKDSNKPKLLTDNNKTSKDLQKIKH